MKTILIACLVAPALLAGRPARADDSTPVGRWKTIDDASGKAKSIVSIWDEDGVLFGKVEELLDPKPDDPNPTCKKCEGELKDQPILGMRIIRDMRKDGASWTGGHILDPDNGKSYRCILSLAEGGKRLKVRGFIGIALLGRTQTWIRVE